MSTAAFDLIVFDVDGTLIDSRLDLVNSVNELLESYGSRPLTEAVIMPMIGRGARSLVERALAAAQCERTVEHALTTFLNIYDRRMLDHTQAYTGVVSMLASLSARVPLAVLTNKPGAPTERLLTALGLRKHFRSVLGGDGPHGRKPSPEGLMALTVEMGSVPQRTLMVGDSLIDLETAANARTRCCLVEYGFGFPGRDRLDDRNVLVAATPADLVEMAFGGLHES